MTIQELLAIDDDSLRSILSDVSMQNSSLDFHWKFEVEPLEGIGWFISVTFSRPDTLTGVLGIGRGRRELVTFGATESNIVKTCWLLIELVVKHELMEGFRWNGKRIFNPHNSVYVLASIQGD